MRWIVAGVLALLLWMAAPASAQSSVERSPNVHGVEGIDPGTGLFVLSHRFEFLNGGDELISIPTLTLGVGLPWSLALGVDFTSYSEVVPSRLTGNEGELWLKRPFAVGAVDLAGIVGYNTAAESLDGAVDVRVPIGRVRLFGEARAFSDLFGSGDPGAAATVGGALRLTEYLAVTGDYGGVISESDVPGAWSAALAMEIPASPHTLALVMTNSGAATLHGVSREKTVGPSDVRYGFTFTVPLGGRGRWGRVLDPVAAE